MLFKELKEKILAPVIQRRVNQFKVSRVNYHSVTELRDGSSDSLYDYHIMDGSKLFLEEGTPLQDGQVKIKFWYFDLSKQTRQEQFAELFEYPVQETATIAEIKKELLGRINEKLKGESKDLLTFPPEHTRIREQFDKLPGRIYPDNKMLKDAANSLYSGKNLAIQPISGPETVTGTDQISLFVFQWHPDKFELSDPTEFIFEETGELEDIKKQLSQAYKIPVEDLGMAKAVASWPRPSVWEVPDLEWNRKVPDHTERLFKPGTLGNTLISKTFAKYL